MALTRFGNLLIDLEHVYALRVSTWLADDSRRPAEIGIFFDVPHLAHGQEAAHVEGESAISAWNRIISEKKFIVAGSIAFDLSKVCAVHVSEDHTVGSIFFRLKDQGGTMIPLDQTSAGVILNVISAVR